MSAQTLDILPSDTLPARFGRYVLIERVAVGGMAEIFLAQRIEALLPSHEGRLVVIKRVLPELLREPSFRDMLVREAAIAERLHHPNIARVFGVESVGGRQCIAMEHVVGVDVRQLVRLMRADGAREVPLELSLSIVAQVCAGLDYAHSQRDQTGEPIRIVHRDISPQNVMVGLDGVVRIVDFGVARCAHFADQEITRSGRLKGKLPYMSPEQARAEQIDHRSDLFSAAVMLFELTTGRRLFKAKSEFETLKNVCEANYRKPSEVKADYPPELEAIVMKALSAAPGGRYTSGAEMGAALSAFAASKTITLGGARVSHWMRRYAGAKLAEDDARIRERLHVLATEGSGTRSPFGPSGCADEVTDVGDRRSHSTVRPIAATNRPLESAPVRMPIGVVALALAIGTAIGALGARFVGAAPMTRASLVQEAPFVHFHGLPNGLSEVLVDGVPHAVPLQMMPGKHRLQVNAPGYLPWSSDLTVEFGNRHDVDVQLQRAD